MAVSKYPNQGIVKITNRLPTDKDHPYNLYNAMAFNAAMRDLKGEHFKLWCYLAHFPEGTEYALGQVPVFNATGIKKDTYYKAKEALIEKGYLIPDGEDSWVFCEMPEKPIYTAKDF